MEATIDLRYPIGRYAAKPFAEELKDEWIADIRFLPQLLENSLLNLDAAQIDSPYREGGWTVRQVVHHVADSHMNAYCRFKLALTETNPVIKPYMQDGWAAMIDSRLPPNISLTLLHALHARWVNLLEHITNEEWESRTVFHPEHEKQMSLWYLLGMYSWHGRHHLAHITTLRDRMGW